jgi:NADH-quinone oxidoreductase subunit C
MSPEALARAMVEWFGDGVSTEITHGQLCADVGPYDWVEALTMARDGLGCTYFDWLSGVDDLDRDPPGITIVTHLYSPAQRHQLLLRTRVTDFSLSTATGVYPGANWHERETHEMFGVVFDGHPNLIPLLLPDGFEGTPLRKDFVLASRVAKQWPGEVDPGQSLTDLRRRRRRNLPPGVPDPDEWGPNAKPAAEP